MQIAAQLSDFVATIEGAPKTAEFMAGSAIVDVLAAAIAGHGTPAGRCGVSTAAAIWGDGEHICWFSPKRLSLAGAVLVNSTIASVHDLDDGHRAAAGHPGSAIIPAVIAEGIATGKSAGEIRTSIAIGYEVAVRFAASRDLDKVDTLVSGRWCGHGVAAAIGWLRGYTSGQTCQAMAIADSLAPNLKAVAYSKVMGNQVKEGIPWAAATGLAAAEMAAKGVTACTDFLDNPALYDPEILLNGLPTGWAIETIYFKPYGCCRWAHAAIDALLDLQHEHGVSGSSIRSITVRTFSRTLQLDNEVAPQSIEAAQYSVPYCLALAAIYGSEKLLPLDAASLNDAKAIDLAKRIRLEVDPELDRMFSAAVPAEVDVLTTNGRLRRRTLAPKGDPDNPMSRAELESKLGRIASRRMPELSVSRIKSALMDFENNDPSSLKKVLSAAMEDIHNLYRSQGGGVSETVLNDVVNRQ